MCIAQVNGDKDSVQVRENVTSHVPGDIVQGEPGRVGDFTFSVPLDPGETIEEEGIPNPCGVGSLADFRSDLWVMEREELAPCLDYIGVHP